MSGWWQAEPTFVGTTTTMAAGFSSKTVLFKPTTGGYEVSGASAATTLPYDTAAHTRLTLGDEGVSTFSFGTPFSFFGETFQEAKICANGYIMFNGACEWQFTTDKHYSAKRIRCARL